MKKSNVLIINKKEAWSEISDGDALKTILNYEEIEFTEAFFYDPLITDCSQYDAIFFITRFRDPLTMVGLGQATMTYSGLIITFDMNHTAPKYDPRLTELRHHFHRKNPLKRFLRDSGLSVMAGMTPSEEQYFKQKRSRRNS